MLTFLLQGNPRSIAIKAVAKANGLDLEKVAADASKPSVEHLKASPLGKIPAFLGEDGFPLSECIAIAIYGTSRVIYASCRRRLPFEMMT